MFSGNSSEFVQKPVAQWSNADVMAWLEGLGDWASHENISHVFQKEVTRIILIHYSVQHFL